MVADNEGRHHSPVLLSTCDRRISPLDMCLRPKSRRILEEMVPLPDPGAPRMTILNNLLMVDACHSLTVSWPPYICLSHLLHVTAAAAAAAAAPPLSSGYRFVHPRETHTTGTHRL